MEDTNLSALPPDIMMPQSHPSPIHRRLARSTVVPALALATLWTTSARLAAQSSYSQNFNSQTPGNTATGFTEVRPVNATTGASGFGAVIINQSLGDNALNLYDNLDAPSGGNARVQQDFTSSSLSQVSLEFQRNADLTINTSTASTQALYVAFGLNGQGIESGANRHFEVRLYNNGQYRINRGIQDGSGNFSSTDLDTAGSFEASGTTFGTHTLHIYAHSGLPGDAAVGYTGPDSTPRFLDANSFSVFINGTLINPTDGATANGNFGMLRSATYGTASNIGRFGLLTGGASSVTGVDFIVDNILLFNQVPEASTGWALLPTGLALLAWRRLRRR
jgi:hypothetical protein